MCSPEFEFLYTSVKGTFPTQPAISTLFTISDFTGKGLYWQMQSISPWHFLNFLSALELFEQEMLKISHLTHMVKPLAECAWSSRKRNRQNTRTKLTKKTRCENVFFFFYLSLLTKIEVSLECYIYSLFIFCSILECPTSKSSWHFGRT